MGEGNQPIESMEAWLSRRPYWEQFLWYRCYENSGLTDEMIERCFEYLGEEIGIREPGTEERQALNFRSMAVQATREDSPSDPVRLLKIRDFRNVNALSRSCEIPFDPGLTLIYGVNGSGKSGVARLLANACFSRGKREVLPNLENETTASDLPSATFVLADLDGNARPAQEYVLGGHIEALKRFAVFDSKSVPIHLDGSNKVSFSPAYIQVFDRVAFAIQQLEKRLTAEKIALSKPNPFESLFLDNNETSDISKFCKSISAATTDEAFLQHANYQPDIDESRIQLLRTEIEAKRKLDVPAKKALLLSEAKATSPLFQ